MWKHRILPYLFSTCFLCAMMDTENRVLQHIQKINFLVHPIGNLSMGPSWLPEEHHLPIGSIFLNQSVSFNHPETQKNKNVLYYVVLFCKFSLLPTCTISIISVFEKMLKVFEVYLSIGSTLSTIGLSLVQKCFKHSS